MGPALQIHPAQLWWRFTMHFILRPICFREIPVSALARPPISMPISVSEPPMHGPIPMVFLMQETASSTTIHLVYGPERLLPKHRLYLNIRNAGCPNIFTDTFHVRVMPALSVFAGKDSSVLANQKVQLTALVSNGAEPLSYSWSPATLLDNPLIPNPVAVLSGTQQQVKFIVTARDSAGCSASDDIVLQVFNTGPEIFVPSAFTPNDDGRNDILKPIPVGVTTLRYFMVYNRWGQLLFSTSEFGKGWDGKSQGVLQPSGTYVYTAEGIDFDGNRLFRKGTTVLIR